MRSSPSSSARKARQALADRLREIRLDACLSARELARRAGWHESKTSRIEHARTAPSETDIRLWCDACGASDEAPDLIASARAVESMYVEWRRLQRNGLRHLQDLGNAQCEAARHIRAYHSQVIPGFLQTPQYATALLSAITAFHQSPDDVEHAVATRMERHRFLREGRRRFAVVIEEAVLRYQIGDGGTMAGQLGHLLDEMTLPTLSVGIIPFSRTVRPTWTLEGFTIFDEAIVGVELLSADVTITQPREIELYSKAFAQFGSMAVYDRQARALIGDAIKALG